MNHNIFQQSILFSQKHFQKYIKIQICLIYYKSGYSYSMDIKQKYLDKSIQFIKLTPIDKNSDLFNLLKVSIESIMILSF